MWRESLSGFGSSVHECNKSWKIRPGKMSSFFSIQGRNSVRENLKLIRTDGFTDGFRTPFRPIRNPIWKLNFLRLFAGRTPADCFGGTWAPAPLAAPFGSRLSPSRPGVPYLKWSRMHASNTMRMKGIWLSVVPVKKCILQNTSRLDKRIELFPVPYTLAPAALLQFQFDGSSSRIPLMSDRFSLFYDWSRD